MRRENLRGPIFNNFDIGGYLIYLLYRKSGFSSIIVPKLILRGFLGMSIFRYCKVKIIGCGEVLNWVSM